MGFWRVLVVEDSPTAREALVAAFQSAPEFRVIGAVDSGDKAVRLARRLRPDLMSVDVMLPDTDGISVIRQVLKEIRTRILVVSSRTPTRESPLALDALKAGAMEILAKPNIRDAQSLQALLSLAMKLCEHPAPGPSEMRSANEPPPPPRPRGVVTGVIDVAELRRRAAAAAVPPPPVATLPRLMKQKARVIVIGASTGGPAALEILLRRIPLGFRLPIVVAQHLSAGYGEGLVAWLQSAAQVQVKVAEDGEMLQAGTVYFAPDWHHLTITSTGMLSIHRASAEVVGHVPSVDRLFDSVANAFASAAVGVLLTGMGDDGAKSLQRMRNAGAVTIAQDRESSFVYGMPHAAVQLDPQHLVLSLEHIAHYIAAQGAASE